MTKDEALKLALEALEYWQARDEFSKQTSNAITAINEALAEQPAQQQKLTPYMIHAHGAIQRMASRKPLTDEEIIQIASTPDGSQATTKGYVIPFARAIEAAHGITGEQK